MLGSHEEFVANIKKYVEAVDEAAVAGIAKHCGIALQSRDASLVAATDPDELARVRNSFLKKKLALAHPDAELDGAVTDVMHRMAGIHDKHRVTVYYLLAEKFGKLAEFHGKDAAAHG